MAYVLDNAIANGVQRLDLEYLIGIDGKSPEQVGRWFREHVIPEIYDLAIDMAPFRQTWLPINTLRPIC